MEAFIDMKPIPVLGTMIYNRPDYLERMIRSIDYPIGKLVVVLNAVTAEIAATADLIRRLYPNVIIYNPGFNQPKPVNLGFAGGWNYVLRNHMAEWVLVVGNDVQFHPGQLQKIAEYYARHENDSPPMGVVNTSMGWHVHGITRHGLNVLGYLDENMYPCYYDDCDHDYRHTLAQRKNLVSYPAEGECHVHIHHEGSATSRNLPPEKAERMAKAFERNEEYYSRKWGGTQTKETFQTPFNNPALSIKDWSLEPGRWQLNSLDG
jgi:glycosyltransferase involved in cell wall biosynthesis